MRQTVSDRLRACGCLLVGRHREVQRARELLAADQRPAALYVHGPGGVGKTAYLREIERLAEASRPTVWVDCDELDGTTTSILTALGARRPADLVAALPPASVIFVDRMELLAPLERWFWRDLMLALPTDALLIVAGRYPPRELGDRLRDAGLVEVLALRNLVRDDAAELLRLRRIPPSVDVDAVVTETHGHPLALVIATEAYARTGPEVPDPPRSIVTPLDHPDAADQLLARFVDDVDEPLQRQALHVAGHVRRVDRVLLRVALDIDSAQADGLLDWLADRPYAEAHPDGLALHDVVRDALDRDLWWRDPDGYEGLHAAIRDVIIRRLRHGEGSLRQRAAWDLLYLHHGNPATRALYDYQDPGRCTARQAGSGERSTVLDVVNRFEGPVRADAAGRWCDAQPAHAKILEDPFGNLVGVALTNWLDSDPELRAADPVATAAWDQISRRRPPRPGERVLDFLAINARYPELARNVNEVCSVLSLQHYSAPGVGWVIHASRHIDQWRSIWAYIGFEELGLVQLTDGSDVSIWARDFVRTPFEEWLAEMRRRELDHSGTLPGPVAARVAWPRADFEQHARSLLRDFHRLERLAASPLVRCELVDPAAGASAAEQLRAAVEEAVARIEEDPVTERAARAVDRTYLRRAATQESAAEVLGMPFSTYRRHLAKGVDAVIALLWAWETQGGHHVSSP